MIIAATTVCRKGSEDERQNQERLSAAEQALEKAVELGGDLLALPAGFFSARSLHTQEAMAHSLISKAKQLGIAIAFGIDRQVKNPQTDWEILITGRLLPYYGYAWSPSDNLTYCWQQRSSTSSNQKLVSDGHCKKVRLLKVGDDHIGILLCGEIFNQRIRDSLVKHSPRPKVVVDLAHIAGGLRIGRSMKILAEKGLAAICCVHAQCEYAMKHCYTPESGRISARIPDAYVSGLPRIELKLWTF